MAICQGGEVVSPHLKNPQKKWNPMSTVPKDGSWFMIGGEVSGTIEWLTSASWNKELNLFYNFVHSNEWEVKIDNPKFAGWLPLYNKPKANVGGK
jgi:hypothetical protein